MSIDIPGRGTRRRLHVGLMTALALAMALLVSVVPAHADSATVTATTAGSKPVGVEANIWGTVAGFEGEQVTVTSQVRIGDSWSSSQTRTTTGYYSLPLTYGSTSAGSYTWRVKATAGDVTVYSSPVTFTRSAKPSVTISTAGSKTAGDATSAWGSVSGFTGKVTVTSQVLVNGKWSTSQSVKTSRSYTIPLTYGASTVGVYKWRVVASDGKSTVVSSTATLRRTPRPTVTATSAGTKPVGAVSSVWGTVSGFSKRATVSSQVLVKGAWVTSQKTKTTGSYTLPLTYGAGTAGTYKWRVVATDGQRTAISPTFTFKRTDKATARLDSRCLTGRAICISKKERKLRWVVDGQIRMTLDVRFGSELTPTRNGAFKINWKSRNHVSSIYHTPMPFAMFFSGGQAIHYSSDFARRGYNGASHGCVNVRDHASIAKLFDLARTGDKVIVYAG